MTERKSNGKSILISGCSSGIGLCVARGLRERGYQIIASARRQEDVEKLRHEGFSAIRLDLDDSESIRQAVRETLTITGGGLYALFNNGAYGQPGAVEDLSRDTLRAQFESNLFGTVELTNQLIPVMRRQGFGRILQNSSVLGIISLPYRGAYNASKYALEGITDTLRLELHGSGIHVSLIEPGPIESRFRANAFAMYKKHIDAEHSAHRDTYRRMEKRLQKAGPAAPFTLPPEAVLKKVIHALESPRPQPRYYVTVPTWLFGILRRLLSTRMLDRVLRMISRGENK
ncbi:MAG: SDR family oxidoreductase [Gammaproteobacteria bacterium]|nr:SDR family oxidoreductase [Gammaproteobacteria bacterium]MCF6361976.1 SDR family oxidoreductase [Gammaproteobacteria bacterium]